MAPWMVPTTTSWGVRRNFSRPRLAIPRMLAGSVAEGWTGGAIVAIGVLLSVSGRRVIGGVVGCPLEGLAGQSQEDLVERWRAQGDVVDGGTGRVQRPQRVPEPVGAGLHADA